MTNVCVDISSLPYNRGVSRYTSNLVTALMAEPQLNLSAYASGLRNFEQLKVAAGKTGLSKSQLTLDRLPPSLLPWFWRFGQYLPYRRQEKPLVFHAWDWHLPPAERGVGLVSTIHDLAMLKFPETAHPQILAHHQKVWSELKLRKAQIVAVSQATKQDIIDLLAIEADRISVVPEALPIELESENLNLSDARRRIIRDELGLTQPFLLFVGTTEPRKNLSRIIEAWKPLADDFQLIVAGAKGWQDITQTHEQLRFLGEVDNQQLATLYTEASALVFASQYEGFGLPILESFHFGTPVITSENSGMKEVAGNAAELVDPSSVSSIRKGIKLILNESIEAQQIRQKKMMIRSQMFSWSSVAKMMVRVYQQAEDEI